MQQIEPYIEEIKILVERVMGGRNNNNNNNNNIKEPFLNQFHFNETCLLLTLVFVIIFMYKKEIMNMLNLK